MRRPHIPPRWVIAVSAAVAAAIVGDSLLYAVLPIVWPQLGLDVRFVGVLLAANRFVRPFANPIAGRAMSRFGVRAPLLAAMLASAVSTAAYAASKSFAGLFAARLLWGICWSFLRLAGIVAALESSGDRRRGYYLGFFNGATRVGSFVAVLAGGAMTDALGFDTTVYVFAAISLAGFLLLLREREDRPQPIASLARDEGEVSPSHTSPDGSRSALAVLDGCNFIQGAAVSGLLSSTLGLWLMNHYGSRVSVGEVVIGAATLPGCCGYRGMHAVIAHLRTLPHCGNRIGDALRDASLRRIRIEERQQSTGVAPLDE